MLRTSLATLFTFGLVMAAQAETPPAATTVEIKNPEGATLGTATLTGAPKGVILRIEAKGLTPGWHGMHFHEKGDCSDAEFKKAGGHVHGDAALVHGLLNPAATDAGDLPNLYVAADGSVTVELYSTLVALTPGTDRPALLDADGSALVIHANPDDYAAQPIGGAGPRVACGVIK
ncbi:superoxide dismutase family protein [Oleomonas cavernae]|uniref:Superoxide dismutase [Cu-Zn] n=1 Tax=Oleomonas cavernae TaxID=2320859 RepID=A0A418WEI0_9PROT|nr:superoxide dismutase family protein [Oleomonas cavernae]